MFAVRQRPELVTEALWAWTRAFVKYDQDGRDSRWLATTGRQAEPLPVLLAAVAAAVAPGVAFTGVLLQAYRTGEASTPCHTDHAQTGFGFILSLGAARTFRVHRATPDAPGCGEYDLDAVAVECVEGTVLLMDEAFHRGWHHQVVPDPDVTAEKLSLVFRTKPGG